MASQRKSRWGPANDTHPKYNHTNDNDDAAAAAALLAEAEARQQPRWKSHHDDPHRTHRGHYDNDHRKRNDNHHNNDKNNYYGHDRRRQREDPSHDDSPRRRRQDDDSPPRRRRDRQDDDDSPPRRRRRRRRRDDDSPRRRHDKDDPSRRRRDDDSPSRRRRDKDRHSKHDHNNDNDSASSSTPEERPNFGLSGALTAERQTYKGVVLKFQEPPEARTPNTQWRLYVFRKASSSQSNNTNSDPIEILHIAKQSAYLWGRNADICDIVLHHASCSSQHAVLQYRGVRASSQQQQQRNSANHNNHVPIQCRPYLMDLESTNGTFLNGVRLDPARYYQLRAGDVITVGASTREYVLLPAGQNK